MQTLNTFCWISSTIAQVFVQFCLKLVDRANSVNSSTPTRRLPTCRQSYKFSQLVDRGNWLTAINLLYKWITCRQLLNNCISGQLVDRANWLTAINLLCKWTTRRQLLNNCISGQLVDRLVDTIMLHISCQNLKWPELMPVFA